MIKYKIEYLRNDEIYNLDTGNIDSVSNILHQEFGTYQDAENYLIANNITSVITEIETEDISTAVLRIKEFIHPNYLNQPLGKIDFRKHLKDDYHLTKDVTIIAGRPSEAIYTYEGVNIARIRFNFEFDQIGFCSRRQEILGYYTSENIIEDEFIISDESYSLTSDYHLIKKIEESTLTRTNIIQELKTTINGFLIQTYMPQGQTLAQVQYTASQLFYNYNASINVWIETGSGDLHDNIINDTTFTWLNEEIATGISIRSYIASKID